MARKKRSATITTSATNDSVSYEEVLHDDTEDTQEELCGESLTDMDSSLDNIPTTDYEAEVITIDTNIDYNKKYGKEYFEFLKKSGCDINFKGNWQQKLVAWLNSLFHLRNRKILDIGCGAGSLVQAFNDAGMFAIGTDISSFVINQSPFDKTKLFNYAAHEVDKIPEKFDFIFSMETFAHIPEADIKPTLQAIHKVCNPAARLFITVKHHPELLDSYEVHAALPQFWTDMLNECGFNDITKETLPELYKQKIPMNFMGAYDWDLFVATVK